MPGGVRHIPASRFAGGLPVSGMARNEAIATDGLWAGVARTPAGAGSQWHHHGSYESAIYVLSGIHRMEFGHGGKEVVEAGPGDFLYVAPGAIHREVNVGDGEALSVVVRAGSGEVVFNVDGPE